MTGTLRWYKSSYSSDSGGECLEAAHDTTDTIHLRDSKHPTGPHLTLSPTAWSAFVSPYCGNAATRSTSL